MISFQYLCFQIHSKFGTLRCKLGKKFKEYFVKHWVTEGNHLLAEDTETEPIFFLPLFPLDSILFWIPGFNSSELNNQ